MSKSKKNSESPEEIVPGSGVYAPWQRWGRRKDWQDDLYKSMAHKATDTPEDDMLINANRSGIGALGAIGIALAAGLPAAVMLWNQMKKPEIQQPSIPQPIVAAPEITVEPLSLKVKWWVDENGKVQSEVVEQPAEPKTKIKN